LAILFVTLAACCIALAAISDVRYFRIPNIYPALILLLFLGSRLVWGFSPSDWSHFMHFVIALGVGMLLFKMGWVGGGDAKLYSAAAIWFTGLNAAMLVFATGLAGLVLAIFYVARRKLKTQKDTKKRTERRIPYGVAIAGGALIMGVIGGVKGLIPLA
jgi:prepilin peptidase CpaA